MMTVESFVGTFADGLELLIGGPQALISDATAAAGLEGERALLAIFVVFLLFSPVCFLVCQNATKPGWVHRVLPLLTFFVWVQVGLGIECRATVSSTGGGVRVIEDMGHRLTQPAFDFAAASPGFKSAMCTFNTLGLLAVCALFAHSAVFKGDARAILPAIPAGCLRMLIGLTTRLPVPHDYQATMGDWPPPSEHCKGFVLNPSGHAIQVTLASAHLARTGSWPAFACVTAFNIFQGLWLITTRGHYTCDILQGVVLALFCERLVHAHLGGGGGRAQSGAGKQKRR